MRATLLSRLPRPLARRHRLCREARRPSGPSSCDASAGQGYGSASKFYPHPAWLSLYAEEPRPMMDHQAIIIAERRNRPVATAVTSCPALVQDSATPIALQR